MEQAMETDSSAIKGDVAVLTLGEAEAMKGKGEIFSFDSSLSPIGLSSPLVK